MTDELRLRSDNRSPLVSEPMVPRPRASADARAVALLAGLVALVAWHAWNVDAWLANFDVLMFYVPWYE